MRISLVFLAVAGIIVSLLALSTHYSAEVEANVYRTDWNSSAVNHSVYSVVYGIPVALIGIAGYALIGWLAFYRHRLAAAICSLFGLGYALYLTNIEAHVLEVWCVYCVVSFFIITLIVFLAFGELLSQRDRAV